MDVFEDYEEMNDDILDKINTTTVEYAKSHSKPIRMAVTVKIATTNLLNLHQRKDTKQIYQVCSKILMKTVTIIMIKFLR